MTNVSTLRLYLLRGAYLLIAVGLAVENWGTLFNGISNLELMRGTVICMLWALSILAILGIRYPLGMLPLIFFEMVWKSTWLIAVALPKFLTGTMDYWATQSAIACLMGVIFPLVIPWGYVIENYVKKGGDPWRPGFRESRQAWPASR